MRSSASSSISLLLLVLLLVCPASVRGEMAGGEGLAQEPARLVVLPVDNMSGKGARHDRMQAELVARIEDRGVEVVSEADLKAFMARYRIRYTGGVTTEVAAAAKKDLGADAILVTSLELYDEQKPAVAVTARLVATSTLPKILWMDSVVETGIDAPGLLGLGIVRDVAVIEASTLERLVESLDRFLAGEDGETTARPKRSFSPKLAYDAGSIGAQEKTTVIVVPFVNESRRKRAGEILMLNFVRELSRRKDVTVIDPGVVRDLMLRGRMIMQQGVANLDVDMLSIPLEGEFVISGRVFDYKDGLGPIAAPAVDFSVLAMQRLTRKVVWGSTSYNQGDDTELFFGRGRVKTAPALAAYMVRSVVEKMRSSNAL